MEKIIVCVCVCVCVNSTFGRGCDCCKKLCADKGSSEPSINSENNETNVNEELSKVNEEENNDTNEVGEDEEKETLYFTKINKTNQNEKNIKKCFNNKWYEACKNKVLLLQEAKDDDKDLLEVTGSGNKWEITDQGKVLENADCNPNNNKWIIVKVTTLQKDLKSTGDSFVFYVDELTSVGGAGVFDKIECYSIKIIAANTRAVQNISYMFYNVRSTLEKDGKEDTGPGLIGLEKLNVGNVNTIVMMFWCAIDKQATLDQLGKWRFSKSSVMVTNLFYSTVVGLDFAVLNDWNSAKNKGVVPFTRENWYTSEQIFVQNNNVDDFKPPNWYDGIKEL